MKNKIFVFSLAMFFLSMFFVNKIQAADTVDTSTKAWGDSESDYTDLNTAKGIESISVQAGDDTKNTGNATNVNTGLGSSSTSSSTKSSSLTSSSLTSSSFASSGGCEGDFEEVSGICLPADTGLSDAEVSTIISNIASWILGLFTSFAIIAFVISGIQYLTSAGSEDQLETAKRNAKYALVGIVVGLSGFVIIQAITMALDGFGYSF